MQTIRQDPYDRLIHGATVLSQDAHGPKVYALADGTVLKLFRRKRKISSAALWPYAKRFAHAARVLARRNIPCVEVTRVARVPHLKRDLVIYTYLQGDTLRAKLVAAMQADDTAARDALLQQHARFLAELHRKRIYFRAIHFNNVIVTPGTTPAPGKSDTPAPGTPSPNRQSSITNHQFKFGLIDISEVWTSPLPLRPDLRARNLRPMLKYDEDRAALKAHGLDRFVQNYLSHAKLNPLSQALFNAWVARLHAGKV